jgi:BirA family transcriptional regulator, biotin operon repressor / biotin---[acetyl-CoA-carboxylase] ligase
VDALTPEVVVPLLRGRFGNPYAYVERTASTQRLFDRDAPEGAVAVAEVQTEGRGRLGRTWEAPAQTSILVSLVLRPGVVAPRLPELSLVAGEAVAAALREATGVEPVVKFPNDVLLDGRKVAGVLAEASDGRVVLGIGVNVNQSAEQLPPEVDATSLRLATGRPFERASLLAAILERLEQAYDRWLSALAEPG